MNHAERIIAHLWPHRKMLMAACLVLSLGLGFHISKLGVNNAIEIWFPMDDPALTAYKKFIDRFGHDEHIVIALHDDRGMLGPDGLGRLYRLHKILPAIHGIDSTDSIVSIATRYKVDLSVLQNLTPESSSARAMRAQVLNTTALRGRWLSEDGKFALMIARMDGRLDVDSIRDQTLSKVREVLADTGGNAYIAGIGVIYDALNRAATHDSAAVTITAYTLIGILLVLAYGRLRPFVISILSVTLAIIATLGIYTLRGHDLNMVTVVIPALILVGVLSITVHLNLSIAAESAQLPMRQRTVRGLGRMLWPCLINALTTMAGLLSLALSPMPVVQHLGIYGAFGLGAGFIIAFVTVLNFAHSEHAHQNDWGWISRRIQYATVRMTALALKAPYHTIAVAVALSLIAIGGATMLKVDTYSIDFLLKHHQVRRDAATIEKHLGHYTALDFTVSAPTSVSESDKRSAIQSWQQRVIDKNLASWSEIRPVSRMPNADQKIHISFGIPMLSAREIDNRIKAIRENAQLPKDTELASAGYLPLYVRMMDLIVHTQLESFAFAFLMVISILAVIFRSSYQLLLIALSNLLPVILILGVMGIAGIRLDVATVTIAAIVFGLVVDDTVQFLYRYRHERLQHHHATALLRTASCIGHAMGLTTLVMVVGFSILAFAAIKSIIWFGLLIALAMLGALVADLMLLPAIIHLWSHDTNEQY